MTTFFGTAGSDQIRRDFLSPGVFSVAPEGLTGTSQGDGIDSIVGLGGDDVIEFGDRTYEADGGEGDDVLDARDINDIGFIERLLIGGDGDDKMYGSDFADSYISSGFDVFAGAGGDDLMVGGAGDDRYVVESLGDRVVDTSGNDTILTNLSRYTLPSGIEVGEFSSPDYHVGIGNAGDNYLASYEGRCAVYGRGGDDYIFSRNAIGRDLLVGGSGNDLLEAVAGEADGLIGGTGRDVFFMNPFSGPVGPHVILAGAGAVAFEAAGRRRGDRIDVSSIDADETADGQQFLEFGGLGKGHLQLRNSSGDTLLLADTDESEDFELWIRIEDGSVRASEYSARDFIFG